MVCTIIALFLQLLTKKAYYLLCNLFNLQHRSISKMCFKNFPTICRNLDVLSCIWYIIVLLPISISYSFECMVPFMLRKQVSWSVQSRDSIIFSSLFHSIGRSFEYEINQVKFVNGTFFPDMGKIQYYGFFFAQLTNHVCSKLDTRFVFPLDFKSFVLACSAFFIFVIFNIFVIHPVKWDVMCLQRQ